MAYHRDGNGQQMNEKAPVAYSIQIDYFTKRLKALYSHWSEHKSDLWDEADALVIATPPPSEDLRYLKSSALNVWLLGYEFPETIMVFMKKAKEALGADIVIHVRAKSDDGTASMEAIFTDIRALLKADGNPCIIVGHVVTEAPEGRLGKFG